MLTTVRTTISRLLGRGSSDRSEAAQKAARTREANARKRSDASRRAAETRRTRDERAAGMREDMEKL